MLKAQINVTRLSEDDTSSVARRVAINDPEEKIPQAEIAKYLGRSQQRVSDYISDIRATQTASRDSLIYRLNLLGWTLEEIEKITGLKKSRLNEISGNTNIGKIGNSLEEWISKGKTVEEAAKKLEIDGILAWAIILKDKDDTRLHRFLFKKENLFAWQKTSLGLNYKTKEFPLSILR